MMTGVKGKDNGYDVDNCVDDNGDNHHYNNNDDGDDEGGGDNDDNCGYDDGSLIYFITLSISKST
jgi:hypothetical protein